MPGVLATMLPRVAFQTRLERCHVGHKRSLGSYDKVAPEDQNQEQHDAPAKQVGIEQAPEHPAASSTLPILLGAFQGLLISIVPLRIGDYFPHSRSPWPCWSVPI